MAARAPRHAHAPALVITAVTHPGRLTIGIDDHDVGDVDGSLLRDDPAALRTTLGTADPGVLLDPVDAFYQHPSNVRVGLDNLALGAFVLAGNNNNRVAFADSHG